MKCPECENEYEGNGCSTCDEEKVKAEETETMKERKEAENREEPEKPEEGENREEPEKLEESENRKTAEKQEEAENQEKTEKQEKVENQESEDGKKDNKKETNKLSAWILAETITAVLLVICFAMWMKLSEENDEEKRKYSSITDDYNKITVEYQNMQQEYAAYKEKMKPYEELDEAEAEARKIEAEKIAEQKKADEEKAAAEAAAAKAAEEAQGYETGITYDQLARTPDQYKGKKVKFYGKVVQVIEGSGTIQIRLAVDDSYDTILLGEYSSDIVSSRVLEDDHITIYGTSIGTITYESTMGGNITIPGISIERIDQ